MLSEYILPDASRENLKELGFRSNGEGLYIKVIPLYKYKDEPVVSGKLCTYEGDKRLRIDLVTNDGKVYPPYYRNDNLDSNKVLFICQRKLIYILKKMGCKKRK